MIVEEEITKYRVCIIGDTDVGKTSLSTRYCHGEFPENSTPTIGASFLQRRVSLENTEINLQIWDTAGQERFPLIQKYLFKLYYHISYIFYFVYNIITPFEITYFVVLLSFLVKVSLYGTDVLQRG